MRYGVHAAAMFAACALSSAAHAQATQPTGFYGGLGVGLAKLNNPGVTFYDAGGTFGGTGTEDTFDGAFDLKDSAIFGGVVGYDFGPVRADLELSYARSKIRALTVANVNGQPVTFDEAGRANVCGYLELDGCGGSGNSFAIDDSHLRQINAMLNAWVDLPIGPIVPYAGGGVGISGLEVEGEGKGKFAWQLGAGAAFQLTPALAITGDYRHREVKRTTIEADEASGFRLGKLKTDSFTVGVRFYFGGAASGAASDYASPPPPPPPPPAAAPLPEPAPAPAPAPVPALLKDLDRASADKRVRALFRGAVRPSWNERPISLHLVR